MRRPWSSIRKASERVRNGRSRRQCRPKELTHRVLTHRPPGRPPSNRRASACPALPWGLGRGCCHVDRRPSSSAGSPSSRAWGHGPVGRQLRGRQVHDPDRHPRRLCVPPIRPRRHRAPRDLLEARGFGQGAVARPPSAHPPRRAGVRDVPDPVVHGARKHERRQLRVTHRCNAHIHGARRGGDRLRHPDAGEGHRGDRGVLRCRNCRPRATG
jgi:hypothetical protein